MPSSDGPGDVFAWLGLGIALVLLSSFGLAQPIRLTLVAVILYVLLTNGPKLGPAFDRLAAALSDSPRPGTGGAGAGGRLLLR